VAGGAKRADTETCGAPEVGFGPERRRRPVAQTAGADKAGGSGAAGWVTPKPKEQSLQPALFTL